jgi:hypothetical protein
LALDSAKALDLGTGPSLEVVLEQQLERVSDWSLGEGLEQSWAMAKVVMTGLGSVQKWGHLSEPGFDSG